jgi:branched-chain amino acid transport system substrate-binding protein
LIPRLVSAAACSFLVLCAASVQAQVKVGVIVSATGAGASLGSVQKKAVAMLPTELGGQKVTYIVMDDASDTNQSVKAARKLISDEKVDVLIGSSMSAPSIALVDVVAEQKVPLVSMAGSSRITTPVDDKRRWAFKTPFDEALAIDATLKRASASGTKRLGVLATSDAYGDTWTAELNRLKSKYPLEIVAVERYAPADTTVLAQAAKVLAAKPDAILVAASGTPAALPHKTVRERGFKGTVYQTYAALAPEVYKLGGKDMEGTIAVTSAGFQPDQLDPSNPIRKASALLIDKYEALYGKGSFSSYVGNLWMASQLVEAAVPEALKTQKPGTPEFRAAIRDQIERVKGMVTQTGYVNMSPTDHVGYDERATGVFEYRHNAWVLLSK